MIAGEMKEMRMDDRNSLPLLVSINEAARIVGLGRSKTYELIKTNELRLIKVGARSLVAMSDLQRFVEEKIEASKSGRSNCDTGKQLK